MFQIMIKETLEFLRDKTNLFFMLMFPLVLIFLLGNLLSSMDNSEEAVGEIKLHYLIETKNPMDTMAIESFIQQAGDNKSLYFIESEDLTASKELAGKDEIAAVVVFTGEPMEIAVYEGMNQIKNRTVSAILNSFVQTNHSIAAVMKTVPGNLMLDNMPQDDYIVQKDLGVKRTMLDYYAVSMLAMICFMSIMIGAGAFVGERTNKTINRMIASPKNRTVMFLQQILGMVPQVITQIFVLMFVSVFVFKAHYAATLGNNIYLFFMFFVVTLSSIAVGAVIGLVIKTNPMAVLMPILWIMMFFGGTYSKELNIKGVTEAMPIYQLQQAAFDLTVFGRHEKVNNVILLCVILMISALIIGAFIFNRKEEER
ncbi:MAG: type transporter [Herbinix sp.]|jgi:ABC-2 type transport system permease protein|nr:type transporter [Herbinix sp.]